MSSAVASFYNDDRCDSSDDDDVDDHNDSDDGGGGRVIIMKAGGSASSKSVSSTGPFTSSSSASKAPKAPVLHLNDLDMGMADEDETDDHLIDDILQDLSAAYDKTLPTEIQQIIVAQQKFKQQQNALRNSSSNY